MLAKHKISTDVVIRIDIYLDGRYVRSVTNNIPSKIDYFKVDCHTRQKHVTPKLSRQALNNCTKHMTRARL